MNPLINHIEYLLTNHDCVVVPGWGAFVAQYSSSVNNELFLKPQRNIGFNASVVHNDGLLANSLAKQKKISFAEALAEIESNVAVYHQLTNDGSEIPFGRLGFFRSSVNGELEFVPFHHEQNIDNYFGLQAFSFPTLDELNKTDEKDGKSVPETIAHKEEQKRFSINWLPREAIKIAASIILLIGMTFVLTTPIVFERNNQEFATMNFPKPKNPTKANNHAAMPIGKKQTAAPMAKTTNSAQQQPAVHSTKINSGKYCLILATFKSMKQTNIFFDYNKDLCRDNVIEKDGNFMVYFDRSDDYKKIVKTSKNLPAKYKQFYIAMQ